MFWIKILVEPEQSVKFTCLNVFGIKMTSDWVVAWQNNSEEVAVEITKIEIKDPSVKDK